MNKGLITLFAAATFACAGSVFAAAPTIGAIPDVSIGDTEAPEAQQFTDSNFFVFTNAFNFDAKVDDSDNTKAELVWSFDEGDDDATGLVATKWYNVNGKDPIHVGTSAIANQDGTTYDAHKAPGANELTQVSRWASFRDVVFSDPTKSMPFNAPTDPAKSVHAAGKTVVFAVSDGQNVTTKGITVRTVDNTSDTLSGGSPFVLDKDQKFDTQVAADWTEMGGTKGVAGTSAAYDSATKSYRVTVSTIGANRYHNDGWQGNRNTWIMYDKIGSGNYVRAKFYVYAASEGTGWTVNDIPAFAMRVSYRLGFCVQQLINPHEVATGGAGAADLRPSTDPNNPSVYRVDFDPVDVPYLSTFSSANGKEGIQAVFEVQEAEGARHGILGMKELVFGTYPASYLTGTPTQSKYWDGTKNATAGDLHMPDSAFTTLQLTPVNTAVVDTTCNDDATKAKVTRTEGSNGVTLTGIGTNTYTASGEWILYPGNAIANTPDFGTRVRVAANTIYKARFHMTSTQASANQSELWFGPRTLGSAFLCRYQFQGGQFASGGKEGNLQAIPGTLCVNPEKQASETNGGWYTVIMNTPYDADIRPDVTGDLTIKMPGITAEKAYGDNSGSSKRDVKLTVQLWDSIPQGQNESGLVTIDRASLEAYPQFDDR